MKHLFGILLLFPVLTSYAISFVGHNTGIAQVGMLENLPCLYLNKNDLMTKRIYIRQLHEEKAKTVLDLSFNQPRKIQVKSCFHYGKESSHGFAYNIPYIATLYDSGIDERYFHHHIIKFCVIRNENGVKLVKTRNTYFWENGIAKCTNKPLL